MLIQLPFEEVIDKCQGFELSIASQLIASKTGRPEDGLERGLGQLLDAMPASQNHAPFGICRTCRHFRREEDGSARCALLDVALKPADESLICPEHERPAG
ncbi:MAG: hypothetical protein AAGI88_22200 [Pseudomonadota bacterium]